MPLTKKQIGELAKYALGKPGAVQSTPYASWDPLQDPHLEVMGSASWLKFFELEENERGKYFMFPVLAEALAKHQSTYPQIRQSSWIERDGHVYMEVPLDDEIPVAYLKTLIDDSHAIVWNKLSASDRLQIELAGMPYDEPQLLKRLVTIYGLETLAASIRKVTKKAILLRTSKSSDAKISLGKSKMGGQPDLPAGTPWPTFNDGKPLAFLAQLDLTTISKLGSPVKGLPQAGLLSLFSAWGWQEAGNADPSVPHGSQEQSPWTVILYSPARTKLQRLKKPRAVNGFRAATIEHVPVLSLPNHREELEMQSAKISDADFRRFDDMQSTFRSLQMKHWLNNADTFASHHLLGGYALFQQMFPPELIDSGRTMLLQIGSDDKTGMCWGDGGELAFYADTQALSKGRFERLWAECQSG